MFAACGECKPDAIPPDEAAPVPPPDPASVKKGKGTLGEYARSEAAILAAMLTLNFNVELPKDGSKNGIVGGLNYDGLDTPAAQLVVLAVTLGLEVVTFTGAFDKMLKKAIAKGRRLFVKQSSPIARGVADALAEKHGLFIADGIRANGTIMPYELAQKFTAGQARRVHAHHLVEVQWIKRLGLGDPNLAPSVLLTEAKHQEIHKTLSALGKPGSVEELLKRYEKAYEGHPEWIEAVKWFLGK